MANLISMAGRGKRFDTQGYMLPKPLIPVMGQPMVWRVIDSLPPSDKWVFIVRQEHIDDYKIDEVIKQKVPNAIITVDKDLLGGASIFCAEQYFDADEPVFIAGCDNGFVFDDATFKAAQDEADLVLWTYTKDQRLRDNPKSWGYCVLGEDGKTITDMSVKIPVSDDPFYDHAVVATFWLKSAKVLYEAIRLMMVKEIKTNNEYYLDNLPLVMNMLEKKSIIFDVDLYVGWGTPEELHKFDHIKHHWDVGQLEKLGFTPEVLQAWKTYFGGLRD